jgi:hypothetical protein
MRILKTLESFTANLLKRKIKIKEVIELIESYEKFL